jgi:hypothetical protein
MGQEAGGVEGSVAVIISAITAIMHCGRAARMHSGQAARMHCRRAARMHGDGPQEWHGGRARKGAGDTDPAARAGSADSRSCCGALDGSDPGAVRR